MAWGQHQHHVVPLRLELALRLEQRRLFLFVRAASNQHEARTETILRTQARAEFGDVRRQFQIELDVADDVHALSRCARLFEALRITAGLRRDRQSIGQRTRE